MGEVARQTGASFGLLPAGQRGLLLDESGWEKSGAKSVGVARQYIGNVRGQNSQWTSGVATGSVATVFRATPRRCAVSWLAESRLS